MKLRVFDTPLSVCKLRDANDIDFAHELTFVGITDREISLACPTHAVPENTLAREDGWRAFRIEGQLDFSLIGILARISNVLADAGVGLFAVSTYDTDYILVKAENLEHGLAALAASGYEIAGEQAK